jgi:UDP-3-O-[3-hydroxymyristoyl] N-acetylglucosamine deacetylase
LDLKGERGQRRPASETTVAARPQSVAEAKLGVRLQNAAGVSVMTVEHLMAAFVLCGIDNALVDVYGPEIPAFDGSTAPIIRLIEQAGVRRLAAAREAIEARAIVRVEDCDRFIELSPAEGRLLDVSIDFVDAAIGRQSISFSLDETAAPVARLGCRAHAGGWFWARRLA